MLRSIRRVVTLAALAFIASPTVATPPGATGAPPASTGQPDFHAISRALPALPATETGWRIPLDLKDPWHWTPIRDAVRVEAKRDAGNAAHLAVTYSRTPRTANGVALVTPTNAFVDVESLLVRITATPDQRLFVTLTDTNGIVWTLPTLRATAGEGGADAVVTLRLADLKPDTFQNMGKEVPAAPDLSTIVMLTILDVSGYMGAPELDCAWTIHSIEGVRAEASSNNVKSSTEPATGSESELVDDFFDALNVNPHRRHETLERLEHAVAAGEPSSQIRLLLGLNHLWIVAEAEADGISIDETRRRHHAAEAMRHLGDAQALRPDDHRIPSWLHSAEYGLAMAEGRRTDADEARNTLAASAEKEPCFHAVALATVSAHEPAESAAFRRALDAMESSFNCRSDNRATRNAPRWPHNVHAFLIALADLRAKANDLHGAEMALVIAESQPGFADWRYRHLVAERHEALDARRTDPNAALPQFIFGTQQSTSCVGCHAR